MFTIDVNSVKKTTEKSYFSYEDVIALMENPRPALHSISYIHAWGNRDGILYPGSKPVKLKNGTHFCAVVTDNA